MRQGRYDRLFIGGKWVTPSTSEQIEVISPVTEEPVAAVPAASVADVDRAVAAARAAFPGWSTTPLAERVEVLRRLRAGLADTAEEMAGLITDEMGCPITQSRHQSRSSTRRCPRHLRRARGRTFAFERTSTGERAPRW